MTLLFYQNELPEQDEININKDEKYRKFENN